MRGGIKFLAQAPIEPTPLVASAINEQLFLTVQLTEPPAILFKDFKADSGGYCQPDDATEDGEIVMQAQYQTTSRTASEQAARRWLVDLYLHETSHRLTPDHGHDAVFATTNFALMLRAGELHPHLWDALSLYDFADHAVGDAIGMVDAFSFIWKHGYSLAESQLDAASIAVEAARRWERYQVAVLARPARKAATQREREKLEQRIESLKMSHYRWFTAGILVTLAVVVCLNCFGNRL